MFCDLPQVPPGPSGKFVIAIMAAVAELEAGLISERTKAALAQAKARGVRLGNPRLRAGTREQALQAAAAKQRQAADRASTALHRGRVHHAGAARDGTERARCPHGTWGTWHAATVWRLLERDAGTSATL